MEQGATISLSDIVGDDTAFGVDQGREVFSALLRRLDQHPGINIFEISLEGIKRTDASFPRESVIQLAKSLKGEKAFFLTGFCRPDLQDNWDYAAAAKDINMLVKTGQADYHVLGKDIGHKAQQLLDFIMREKEVTTSMVVESFDITPQNASARLKKLASLGLALCTKQTAETGGFEFVYHAIQ